MKDDKVNILIVEDNIFIADDLQNLIEEIGYNVVDKVVSYEEAVASLKNNEVDLLFIDINLATKKSGIDLAIYINNYLNLPFIYLTANSDEYTLDKAAKTMPYAYLVKPFEINNIRASIELAIIRYGALEPKEEEKKEFIFIKKKEVYQKVAFDKITYVKCDNVYLEIYTVDKKMYLLRSTLKNFYDLLTPNFYKCNKSYLVNIDFVEKFTLTHLFVQDEKIVISKEFKTVVKSLFM